MQLNATYKPPAGYKPVYKEAKLFIPVSTIAYNTYYVFYHITNSKMHIYARQCTMQNACNLIFYFFCQ